MERPVGYLMKQITDKIKAAADADLKNRNLTLSQVRVLEYISSKGGSVTQKSIEEYLDVSHPTVVGIVARLEKNGYLICYSDKTDRRNKIVAMTERSARVIHEVQRKIAAQEEKLLQGLSAEEIEQLRRLLNTILKNVD